MYIHEAVSAAIVKGFWIARISNHYFAFEPTNGSRGFIVHCGINGKEYVRWNPCADDLIANDWVLVPASSISRRRNKFV